MESFRMHIIFQQTAMINMALAFAGCDAQDFCIKKIHELLLIMDESDCDAPSSPPSPFETPRIQPDAASFAFFVLRISPLKTARAPSNSATRCDNCFLK
jgi:hypothetical protein